MITGFWRRSQDAAATPYSEEGAVDYPMAYKLLCCDQIGEQCEADAGPLDAHQFVKQSKPIEPHSAGREEVADFEGRASSLGHPECHTGAARLQHAERCAQGRAAERVEDQPERTVRL